MFFGDGANCDVGGWEAEEEEGGIHSCSVGFTTLVYLTWLMKYMLTHLLKYNPVDPPYNPVNPHSIVK